MTTEHLQLKNLKIDGGTQPREAISVLLRQFLAERAGASRNERLARYAKTQRALVAFLSDERITRLFAASHEHFPLPEEVAGS